MASSSVRQLFLLLALDVYHSFTAAQESTSLSYSFREEQMEGTFVGNVARDSLLYGNVTQDEFSRMRFQILTQGNQHALLFKINETSSSLYSKKVLDREILCPYQKVCFLNFNVAVYKRDSNNGLLDLYKIIQINVSIEDTNDNSPVFPNSEIALTVEEAVSVGYILYTSAADDKDTGFNNSVQTYELVPGNEMFGLDVTKNLDGSSDLGLIVNFKLDRETRDFYQLKIYARDGGFPQRTGTLTVNMSITDFNDNRPLFSQPTYQTSVPESAALKTPILALRASDADIGQNGEFSYRFNSRVLSKVTDVFAVNKTSGQIYVIAGLDYEEEKQYQFLVEVVDHGRIPLSSSAMVTVDVVDINDNAPQINTNFPPGGTLISESAEVGRYIATVSVSDKDLGSNGKVLCQILGDHFKLEELYTNMYKIVISSKLDYEAKKSHNITLTCQDQGIPQQQNTTSFTIYVKDENDNSPVFKTNMYRATILENLETFQEIVQISANDKDSGENGKVSYFLHTDAGDNFIIDNETGVVKTNAVFDREAFVDSEVRFHVNATDDGIPQQMSSILVVLTLEDINDHPPTFKKSVFIFNALEGQENEPTVGTVTAEDLDAGSNGQFTFSFRFPAPNVFYLNPNTGVIKCSKLDREVKSQYNFTIQVTDKGNPPLSSTAKVTVNVFDDNDNPPVIHMPNINNDTFYVPYTAAAGTVIMTVNATDSDLGNNARLLYGIDSISPNNPNIFRLDMHSGNLSVAKSMHLYDSDTYRVLISVKDSGYSQHVTYFRFNVVVTLTNETSLTVKQKEEQGTNVVIVAVIIVVTIVLSAAIIITICVIRRLDLGHRQQKKNNQETMYEKRIFNSNHNETISTESSQFSDAPLKKKNKKEVSFSLSEESDSVNTSTFTNITSFSTSKHPGITFLDGKMIDNPQASSSLITSNTQNPENSKHSYGDKQYGIDCLGYQADSRPQSPGYWYQQLKEQEAREMQLLPHKNDDAHSEASAESATSDSGRGGSEEDINSNRGHPFSDTDEPYKSGNHSSKNSSLLHSSFDTPIKTKSSDNYPRNISFSDDSVNANTTVDELKSKYVRQKEALVASYMNTHLPNFSQSGISAIQTPSRNNLSHGRTLETLDEASHSAYGLRYSIQDIDAMSDSIATRDDDGASTTTSGSYTINPDELVNEIDNLFFNSDVIV